MSLIKASVTKRVSELMEYLGLFYNLEEILGHMTAFNDSHYADLSTLTDYQLIEAIENAANVIDLNNEEN